MNIASLSHWVRGSRARGGVLAGGLCLSATLAAAAPPALAAAALPTAPAAVTQVSGDLRSVSAVSASDAWAVGPAGTSGRPTFLHWNGSAWTRVTVPVANQRMPILNSVSADSASDAWAVGQSNGATSGIVNLVLHWNGTAWAPVPVPSPGTGTVFDALDSVSALSPTDVWAVGSFSHNNSPVALALHWDGTAWTQVPVPNAAQNTLFAVKGLSPTDAWAVGSTGTGQILVLHWNGTAWIQAATPNLNGQLTAVSALSPTDAWAVGLGGSSSTQSLVLHWDGTSWTRQRSPNPAGTSTGKFNDLNGVAAVSATDAWAVGTYGHQGLMTPAGKPLVLHWDGTSWTQAKAPFFGGFSGLGGVSAVSATNVWAVGSVNSGPQFTPTTLILHWNGTAWTRS